MNTPAHLQSLPAGSKLKIIIMGVLILALSSGFVWMATDQVIAPPLVRAGDILWRLIICRCFFQFDVL